MKIKNQKIKKSMTYMRYFHFPSNNFLFKFCVVFSKNIVLVDMASKHGYDVELMNALDRKYDCQICQLILRDPVQLEECGHRFCKPCMNAHTKK